MEKYTDLNEVLRDPSLAIITDNMATQSELNRIYVRYKVLPKRQRRFCNYLRPQCDGDVFPSEKQAEGGE